MTTPAPRPRAGAAAVVGRVLAGLVGGTAAVLLLACAWVVLSSRFGPVGQDPHGYGLVFGIVVAVASGCITAMVLPLSFPSARWARTYAVTVSAVVVVVVVLIALAVTA